MTINDWSQEFDENVDDLMGPKMKYPVTNGVQQLPTNTARLQVLDKVAGELHKLKGELEILEIGSLYGASASILSQYGVVHCVDLWDWPGGLEFFLQNTKDMRVKPMIGSSHHILPFIKDASCDLIYIDGCHTYPTVEFDIHQAKRLIKPGGIICGDDLEKLIHSKDDFIKAWLDRNKDYIDGYHPGVTCAVHNAFSPKDLNVKEGFWWVNG